MSTPRYAPADDSGRKPYVVEYTFWGKEQEALTYAANASEARRQVVTPGVVTPGVADEYARRVRRATPADVETLA